jgi:glycosyltransferase involved in cell wall biosynthesis
MNFKKYVLLGDANSVHFHKWAKALSVHYQVIIISATAINPSTQINEYEHYSLNIKGEFKPFDILKSIALSRFINKIKPDFVHVHYLSSYGMLLYFALCLRLHVDFKIIATAWGSDVLVTMQQNKTVYWVVKKLLKRCDYISCDAEVVKVKLQLISYKPVHCFTFGLLVMPEYTQADRDLNLYFSNRALYANYNIDQVLVHFAKELKSKPQARLVVANSGDDLEKLKALTARLQIENQVAFVGFLTNENQIKYYQSAAFYYSIPTSDATSVSLLEAMAYGCMPIVSNIVANNEWIIDNENGFYLNELTEVYYNEKFAKNNFQIIELKANFTKSIQNFLNQIEKNS